MIAIFACVPVIVHNDRIARAATFKPRSLPMQLRHFLNVTTSIKDLVKRTGVDLQFLANARALITPGTTLILTDTPVSVSTRSGTGFNILTTAETP